MCLLSVLAPSHISRLTSYTLTHVSVIVSDCVCPSVIFLCTDCPHPLPCVHLFFFSLTHTHTCLSCTGFDLTVCVCVCVCVLSFFFDGARNSCLVFCLHLPSVLPPHRVTVAPAHCILHPNLRDFVIGPHARYANCISCARL